LTSYFIYPGYINKIAGFVCHKKMQSAAESNQIVYLLPVIFGGIVKGELGNPGRVNPGNNFQALHDTLEKSNICNTS